jgi:hypothetical protein
MPVGLFQGEDRREHVGARACGHSSRNQKRRARPTSSFKYFDGLDHGLGTIEYFSNGKTFHRYVPRIFEFMKRFQRP